MDPFIQTALDEHLNNYVFFMCEFIEITLAHTLLLSFVYYLFFVLKRLNVPRATNNLSQKPYKVILLRQKLFIQINLIEISSKKVVRVLKNRYNKCIA